jgi:predicted enzyme related to lactoylglutathione lyase
MKLYGQRVLVDEMDAARCFYGGTLGLSELWVTDTAVGYDVGATLIVELEDESASPSAVGRVIGCTLAVDDIDATYARLNTEGVEFLSPPEAQPWGGTIAHFRDAAGNVLTLMGAPK